MVFKKKSKKSTAQNEIENVLNQTQFDGLSDTMKQHLIQMAEEEQTKFLDEVCGTGVQQPGMGIGIVDGSYYDLPWDTYRDDYILKVESGNAFVDKLQTIEKRFFVSKYGEKLYDNLVDKRNEYEEIIAKKIVESYPDACSPGSDKSTTRTHADIVDSIKKQYELNTALLSFNNENVGEGITSALSYFEDELKNIYGKNATNDRRVEYRGDEIDKLSSWNKYFNIVYFIVFFMIIIMKIMNKNLDLKSNAVTYILIVLFPIFIFPLLFTFLYRIFMTSYGMIDVKNHGPKNAFLDTNI